MHNYKKKFTYNYNRGKHISIEQSRYEQYIVGRNITSHSGHNITITEFVQKEYKDKEQNKQFMEEDIVTINMEPIYTYTMFKQIEYEKADYSRNVPGIPNIVKTEQEDGGNHQRNDLLV